MTISSKPAFNHPLSGWKVVVDSRFKERAKEFANVNLTRLSKNFILRDLLYSTEAALMGLPNLPEDTDMVIRAGKALCEKVLEPVTEHFGRPAITFGYMCREAIEAGMSDAQRKNPRSSSPHQFDRGTFGDEVYARLDLLPFCVEDGLVRKHEFGLWLMTNCDIDLLQQWSHSNIFCITISPRPRRVWHEWTARGKGDDGSNRIEYMGVKFWQEVYPTLPEHQRPKFAPSCSGGAMQWRRS